MTGLQRQRWGDGASGQGMPGATRGWRDLDQTSQHLDFRPTKQISGLQDCERICFCCFKREGCVVTFYSSHRKPVQPHSTNLWGPSPSTFITSTFTALSGCTQLLLSRYQSVCSDDCIAEEGLYQAPRALGIFILLSHETWRHSL